MKRKGRKWLGRREGKGRTKGVRDVGRNRGERKGYRRKEWVERR